MIPLIMPKRQINERALEIVQRVNCDHVPHLLEIGNCRTPGDQAPRLIVPSRTQMAPGHAHVHVDFRDHHFCHAHIGELKLDTLLTDRLKRQIEDHVKRIRPIDFKCGFDAAHLVYVSIFTPEYKYFEVVKHLMPRADVEQAWGALVAHG